MAENIQVASLTAPIIIKIPTQQIKKFQAQLEEVADTLEFIVTQLTDMAKHAKGSTAAIGRGLKSNTRDQKKFVRGQKETIRNQKKQTAGAKRTSKVFGFWADKIAQVRVGTGLLAFALGNVLKLIAIPTGSLAGFTFLAGKVNAMTTEMFLLSKATGFTFNEMRALELEAKSLGFTFEHVNSLAEELNNKFGGEAGGFLELNLQEGLSALNLEAEKLQGLDTPKQLEANLNAAAKLSKERKNLALVGSALDKIGGQEANRLWGAMALKMADMNLSYSELIEHNKRVSGVTDNAVNGARKFTAFFQTMTTAISTFSTEFFGRFGAKIAPFLDALIPIFENLSETILGALGPEFMDTIVDGVQIGFRQLIKVFSWFRDKSEELSESAGSLVKVLSGMFDMGVKLSRILSSVLLPAF